MVETIGGIKAGNAIAGIFGGVTAFLIDGEMTWRDGVALIIVGGITSAYFVPAAEAYLHLSDSLALFLAYNFGILAKPFLLYTKDKLAHKISDKVIDRI